MSAISSLTQIGPQVADSDTANAIRVHTGGAGLILGANERGRPVTVAFFRSEPTVATTIGQLGLAQLIAFRALALGAQLVVATGRPSAWSTFAGAASATRAGAVEIVPPHAPPERFGSSVRPFLFVVDSDSTAAVGSTPSVSGWSTVLTVREQLTSWEAGPLGRADLVVAQSLTPVESALLCKATNLPDYQQAFSVLPDEAVAVITHDGVRWARTARTTLERRVIGSLTPG
ncbi:MAG TPA: hypothetical protein VHX59_17345 [Mycobacteriales bacterium]|nr:hypothetical protein [Mycobacteriales bacterium]